MGSGCCEGGGYLCLGGCLRWTLGADAGGEEEEADPDGRDDDGLKMLDDDEKGRCTTGQGREQLALVRRPC